jgi:hypothetical protein
VWWSASTIGPFSFSTHSFEICLRHVCHFVSPLPENSSHNPRPMRCPRRHTKMTGQTAHTKMPAQILQSQKPGCQRLLYANQPPSTKALPRRLVSHIWGERALLCFDQDEVCLVAHLHRTQKIHTQACRGITQLTSLYRAKYEQLIEIHRIVDSKALGSH